MPFSRSNDPSSSPHGSASGSAGRVIPGGPPSSLSPASPGGSSHHPHTGSITTGILFSAPPPPPCFVGRTQALDSIAMAIGRRQRVLISSAANSPGLGKSSLAALFAQALRDAFPEGVLWLNARVFDPYLLALQIGSALHLDVASLAPPGDAPRALERLLNGRRVLLVLDDLVDPRLLHLIPQVGPAVVCTTDDAALQRLPRMHQVLVGAFSPHEAESFTQAMLGLERWKLEPVACREVYGLLQLHPLAVRLALGAVVDDLPASGPAVSLMVRDLRAQLSRLQRFGGERRWVGAAAARALEGMSLEVRSVAQAASALPLRSFSLSALSSVAATSLEDTALAAQRLVSAGFLQPQAEARFSLHPLLLEPLAELGPLDELRTRAAAFFLSHCLSHTDQPREIDAEIEGVLLGMSVAMEQGEARTVKDFALALGPYFDARGFSEEVPRRLHMGLAAARHTRDPKAEGRLNRWLGRLFFRRGAAEAARERLEASLALATEHQDKSGRVTAMLDLARVEAGQDNLDAALSWLEQGLTLTRGRMGEEGHLLLELARVLHRLDRKAESIKSLEACLTWARKRKDAALEAEVERLNRAYGGGLEISLAAPRDTADVVARLGEAIRTSQGGAAPASDGNKGPTSLDFLTGAGATADGTGGFDASHSPGNRAAPTTGAALLAAAAGAGAGVNPSGTDGPPQDVEPASPVPPLPEASPSMLGALRALVANLPVEQAQELLTQRLATSPLAEQVDATEVLAGIHQTQGNIREAEVTLARGAELAVRAGQPARAADLVEQVGRMMAGRGQAEVAMRYLERSFRMRDSLGDRPAAARTLQQMGQVAADVGDYDTAFYHFMRGLERTESLSDSAARADAIFRLGLIFAARGDDEEALSHFDMAEEMWLETRDMQGLAAVLQARGRIFARRAQRDDALKAYARSIEIADGLNDDKLKAAGYHQMGLLEAESSHYPTASDYFRKSLALKRAQSDLRGMATTLHAMAQLEATHGKHAEARKHYERVLEIAKQLNNARLQVATLRALGDVQATEGQSDEALKSYEEAAQLQGTGGEKREQAALLLGRGSVLTDLGRLPEALEVLQSSLALSVQLQDKRSEAAVLYQLGLTLAEQGEDVKAVTHLQQSLEIDEQLGNARGAAMTLGMLGQLLQIMGLTRDGRILLEDAAKRMQSLEMPELNRVKAWLEGRTE